MTAIGLFMEQGRQGLDIVVFSSSSKLAISALQNGFVSKAKRKQKSQYLIEKIVAFGKAPFIFPKPLTPTKKDDMDLLVWMGIINK